MPQVKIQDALDAIEVLSARVKAIEISLENDRPVENTISGLEIDEGIPIDIGEELERIEKMIINLRRDVGKHVTIYNKHIMQQHKSGK